MAAPGAGIDGIETRGELARFIDQTIGDLPTLVRRLQAQVAAFGGGGGGPPSGPAGGDLSGTYPNPQIAAGAITDGDVNAANKDGAAGTPSMRTLGTGAQQAMPGNTPVGGTPSFVSLAKYGVD